MRSFIALGTLGVMLCCLGKSSLAGEAVAPIVKAEPVKINPKLAALGDNTWVKLSAGRRGGGEAGPLTSIEKHGLVFKYGGCGDPVSSYGQDYASQGYARKEVYSNGSWAVDAATGQWKIVRPFDPKFPEDRPGNGCSRGHCYDSKRGLVWMYGAEAGHNGSQNVWSLWTYDAGADKFELAAPPPPPRKISKTMVHDPVNDVLVFTSGATTWVFHCDTRKWEGRNTPGAPGTGSYNAAAFDAEAKRVVLPIAQPTGRESDKKEPDTRTTIWRPLEKGGKKLWQEFAFSTWTYDAAANKWEKLEIKPEDAPPPRCRHGVTYDSLNKRVVVAAGSTDTWDSGEKQYNDLWVLDTKAGKWTEMKPAGDVPRVPGRDNREFAYVASQNACFFVPAGGDGVYAYRYKKAEGKN